MLSRTATDALHARRLLNIEVKNYDRVKRHVKDFIDRKKNLAQPPTFSDDIDGTTKQAALDEFKQSQANESKAAKEDLNMELQAYKAYIRRTQFLLNQNEEERKRYEDKKKTLTDKISEIRKANEALRERLAAAQQKRETREKYDKLAETITSKPHLKPREEQRATNEKLQAEIDELDHEHTEYTRVWSDRREQFSRIVDQGQQLLRSIKDEKEEAERKEGLDDMGESARDTPQLEELALAPGATENEDQGNPPSLTRPSTKISTDELVKAAKLRIEEYLASKKQQGRIKRLTKMSR